MLIRPILLALVLPFALGLAGCSKTRAVGDDEYVDYRTKGGEQGKLFGDQGLSFGVGKGSTPRAEDGAALGVNAYLWRAALDTLAFMPLSNADPFGGTIITDWYSPPGAAGERFRAQAYVLGRQLRSDGVRVQVFRQTQDRGQWVDSPVSPATNSEMEDKVLARARELRSQSASR